MLLLWVVLSPGMGWAAQRSKTEMDVQWVRQWVAALAEPQTTARDLQRRFGGELKARPPNQAELRWATGDAEMAELVLSEDHRPQSPVVRANLVFRPQSRLTLGALAEEFGAYQTVPEDRKVPAPAELVSFGWMPQAAKGAEILLRARVTRPASAASAVRSLNLVRSHPAAK